MAQNHQVFLDIDIGDAVAYNQKLSAYNRAVDFWKKNGIWNLFIGIIVDPLGSNYGWIADSFDALGDEEKQNLLQIYQSDKNNKVWIPFLNPHS